MTASHYTVHFTEETKTRHANTKFFLLKDIVWRKNIESIRSYSTCAKEKISVLWRLLMLFLVKRTMSFALRSISTPELSTAAYSTLKLCRWVDLLNSKATYPLFLFLSESHLWEMNNGSLVFFQKISHFKHGMTWLESDKLTGQLARQRSLSQAISLYWIMWFAGCDHRSLDCINDYRWSRAI